MVNKTFTVHYHTYLIVIYLQAFLKKLPRVAPACSAEICGVYMWSLTHGPLILLSKHLQTTKSLNFMLIYSCLYCTSVRPFPSFLCPHLSSVLFDIESYVRLPVFCLQISMLSSCLALAACCFPAQMEGWRMSGWCVSMTSIRSCQPAAESGV